MSTKLFPSLESVPSEFREPLACPACHTEHKQGSASEDCQAPTLCSNCHFPILLIAGKYRLLRRLSQNSKDSLYLARHIQLGVERVVKFLKPTLLKEADDRRRFFHEVGLTSSISQRSNHIVRVFDEFGEVDKLGFFYVVENLQGQTLSDFLRKEKPSIPLTLQIFQQLCDAVSAAHSEGILHRSLNPSNVYLIKHSADSHYVKVTGFGAAQLLNDTYNLTQEEDFAANPFYLSPEQCLGADVTSSTDLYALGAILYHMLTGAPPHSREFNGSSGLVDFLIRQHLHPHSEPSAQTLCLPQGLPEPLGEVVMALLQKDSSLRHQSVQAVTEKMAPLFHSLLYPSLPRTAPLTPTEEFSHEIERPWSADKTPVVLASFPFQKEERNVESRATTDSKVEHLGKTIPASKAPLFQEDSLDTLQRRTISSAPCPQANYWEMCSQEAPIPPTIETPPVLPLPLSANFLQPAEASTSNVEPKRAEKSFPDVSRAFPTLPEDRTEENAPPPTWMLQESTPSCEK